jgi:hypothetical protein
MNSIAQTEGELRAMAERLDDHVSALSSAEGCKTLDVLDALVMMERLCQAADFLQSASRALGFLSTQGRRARETAGPTLVVDNTATLVPTSGDAA